MIFIDMDSGTVLNGPIFMVEVSNGDLDALMDSDSAARDYALAYGTKIK